MPKCIVTNCVYNKGGPEYAFFKRTDSKTGYRSKCKSCEQTAKRTSKVTNGSMTIGGSPGDDMTRDFEATIVANLPVKSVEELIQVSGVNLKEWNLTHQKVSSRTDLATSKSSISISATLDRKPLEEFPISRIILPKIGFTKPRPSKRSMLRALIVPDAQIGGIRRHLGGNKYDHVPYHDRSAIAITLEVAKRIKPDLIGLLGDWHDYPDFSKFRLIPEHAWLTNMTHAESAWWLHQYRQAAPHSKIKWCEGNHEARLWKQVLDKMEVLYNVRTVGSSAPALSIPALLDLDKIGVEYIGWGGEDDSKYPDSQFWLNENLLIKHGNKYREKALKSVESVLDSAKSSVIVGHIHRTEMASKTTQRYGVSGNEYVTYTCASPGTLAMLDGPVPKYTDIPNWQNGFAVVDYEEGNGGFQINLFHIYNGECIFEGERLIGNDLYDYDQLHDEALKMVKL